VERILSQDEIGELLSAVQHGDIPVEPEVPRSSSRGGITRVNLVNANISGQMQFGNFDLLLDAFGRNYSVSLTNRVQQPVSIKRTGLKADEFESFLQGVGENTAMGLYRFEPYHAGGMLLFDANLGYALIEILLGGSLGTAFKPQNRPLTGIELNILSPVYSDACLDMVKAFGDLETLQLELLAIEGNPRMVNHIPADNLTTVAGYEIDLAGQKGTMVLVTPMSVVEPLRDRMQGDGDNKEETGSWAKELACELQTLPTEISAQLGEITLEMRDFINFQIGDIIDLPWSPADPLTVRVEGRPKYLAQAGVRNGNKAIRIAGIYNEGAHHGNQ